MRDNIPSKCSEANRRWSRAHSPVRIGACGVLAVWALVLGPDATAHTPAPDHGCVIPQRPLDDQDDVRWAAYLAAVDGYRACINQFAQSNRAASTHHNAAANAAIAEWNAFVADQLNVPEDFPWPPVGRPTVAPAVR